MSRRRGGLWAILVALAAALALITLPGVSRETVVIRGRTMGTVYSVHLADGPISPWGLRRLRRDIQELLGDMERLFSLYDPDSELSLFNAWTASVPMPVSASFAEVAQGALAAAEASGGAFDPTVGPLVDLWGFGGSGRRWDQPPEEAQAAARALTGYWRVRLAPGPGLVKEHAGVRLDLGGIAKGYGVDRVGALLESKGFSDFLVEIGGDLLVRGERAPGRAWRVGVQEPLREPGAGTDRLAGILVLDHGALATSGDYRNYFIGPDGAPYAHLMDPRTGRPAEQRLASVTVLAPAAMTADAWATALFVCGPEEGLRLAEENPDLEALLIGRHGPDGFQLYLTSGFAERTGFRPPDS